MAEQIFYDDALGAPNLRPRRRTRIAAWLASEQDRWVLWAPVALGIGSIAYFRLPTEPPAGIGLGLLLLMVLSGWLLRHRPAALLGVAAMGLCAAGFAAAQLRTAVVEAPILERRLGPLPVEGRVVGFDQLVDGTRLVLDMVRLEGVREAPARIRLRTAAEIAVPVGARVRVAAVLQPPPRPAAPGSYDFGRQLFFEGIGAVGYATGRIEVLAAHSGGIWADTALASEWFRQRIADRVAQHMDGAEAALANALLTGERAGIPESALRAMQASGLAHLLAISGMHISFVAGIVFFLVRAGLALVEPVALRWPIKKWAAAPALVAATGYTLLVGAPVPTQRALIMTGLVLLAVLFDRNPLSLRLIAFAAMAVMLVAPESVLGPSFQMSFGAVLALIAGYEKLAPILSAGRDRTGLMRRSGLYLAGMVATSVLASLATLPFGLYHFQQAQLYGVLANMVAVPLTAFWIMPMGLLVCAALPLGIEAWPMVAMEWGLALLLVVATWVAELPGAVLPVAAMPDWGLAALTLGGLWLALWQRLPRLFGLVGIVVGAASIPMASTPDMLVSGRATLVALMDPEGQLMLSSRSADRFTAEIWLRRNAQTTAGKWPEQGEAMGGRLRCDMVGCIWQAPDGRRVAIAKNREALDEDCLLADIVVSLVPAGRCRAPAVIDFFDLWRHGAHALYFTPDGLRVETVQGERGSRPWAGRHPAQ